MKRYFAAFVFLCLLLSCFGGMCFAADPVAEVTNGGATTRYDTLEEAVAQISKDGTTTLTLLKDCETSGKAALTAPASFTLDLNGHMLKSADKNGLYVKAAGTKSGITTVKNGIVWAGGAVGVRIDDGSVRIENATIYGQIGVGLYTNDKKYNADNLITDTTIVSYVWACFIFNNQTNIQSGIEMTMENTKLIAALDTTVFAARGTGNTVHIGKNVAAYSYNPSGNTSKVTLDGEALEPLPDTATVEIPELGLRYEGLSAWGKAAPPLGFADGEEIDSSYLPAVETLTEAGIMKGFEDGTFRPKAGMTRAEGAALVYAALTGKTKAPEAGSAFSDLTGHPAAGFAAFCLRLHDLEAWGEDVFRPDEPLTDTYLAKLFLAAAGGYDITKLDGGEAAEPLQQHLADLALAYNCKLTGETITRQQACQLALNFRAYRESRVLGLRKGAVSFAWGKNVKLLGRAEALDNGVRTTYPGDGVEFTVICGGDFLAHFDKKQAGYYRLSVDGRVWDYNVLVGSNKTMADLLPVGEHTIRIVQENDTSTTGRTNVIEGVTLLHKPGSVQPTAKKELYIEFLGDSITAGMGTMGTTTTPWGETTHSATHSYAYMTANLLDADYAMIAKGGIGAYMVSGSSNGTKLARELYLYQNIYREAKTKAVHGKADIIVVAVGTNDSTKNPDTPFETKFRELLLAIREVNPDAKIVVTHGMMNTSHIPVFTGVVAELGGEAKGFYRIQLDRLVNGVPAGSGKTPHPSAADNERNAAKLADFLRTLR